MNTRYLAAAATLASFVTAANSTARAADQKHVIGDAVSRIVEARDKTEDYVVQMKKGFKPDTANYQQARNLYVEAMSKHNAWAALVKASIQSGKTKNLEKSDRYQTLAAEAEQASQQFIRHVQSKIGVPPDRALPIPLVAGAGLNIWNAIKDSRQQARDVAAENFEKEVRWKNWDAVGATP